MTLFEQKCLAAACAYVVCMFVAIVLAHRFNRDRQFDDGECFMAGLFWPFVLFVLLCSAFNAAAKVVARRLGA